MKQILFAVQILAIGVLGCDSAKPTDIDQLDADITHLEAQIDSLTTIDHGADIDQLEVNIAHLEAQIDSLIIEAAAGAIEAEPIEFEGDLFIHSLSDLIGFAAHDRKFRISGDLIVETLPDLHMGSLEGLENLVSIGGDMRISHGLSTVDGLDNLTSIGGSLVVGGLTSLKGLRHLTSIGNDVRIAAHRMTTIPSFMEGRDLEMTTLEGLEGLTRIEGELIITDNVFGNSLTSLKGLNNLTSISQNLVLESLGGVTSLEGLENLVSVDGTLEIEGSSLSNLKGLNNLTSVEGLYLRSNLALTSLEGLEQLTSIDYLYFRNNSVLPDSEIQAFIDRLRSNNPGLSVEIAN